MSGTALARDTTMSASADGLDVTPEDYQRELLVV